MRMSCFARAAACAWGWLDELRGLPVLLSLWCDPFLGAIVIVRIALKFEIPEERMSRQALRLYRPPKLQKEAMDLERAVVQALPGWRWRSPASRGD